MEVTASSPAEMNSGIYLNKKRKSQAEVLGMPSPKHVRWGQRLESDSSSDCNIIVRGDESDLESVKDSNSFHENTDSAMSTYDEPSTSSASWGGNSAPMDLYSLESRSMTKSNTVDSKSLSITDEDDCSYYGYGLDPSLDYEEQLLEFGNNADFYGDEGIEKCTDKDLDNLLYSNGVAPSNYVLSSGRWSVNQETQPVARKLTIDKEFEQYFSTLML